MNDLEELKSLLFGAEKQVLDSITERVQKPETRAVDVADILPEAVRLSHRQGRQLVTSLREPVGQCLKESLHEAPNEYADALYPVMGPAIRKSIASTLRAFAQQINETVEQSLSAKGVKWRLEAWRAGVPFGEYVVQQTLLYRIEQAYLISRENGLLVGHVHHDASRIKDSDAVSAMFTAIQDFVKESFSPDRSGRLETADMGDFTLWAVHGPHALLVCVIRGVPPRSLRADLSAILERIHFRYGDSIRLYSGDTSTMQGVEEELADCLRFEARQTKEAGKRRLSAPLIIALLAVLAVLIYFGVSNWLARQQQQRLAAVIDGTPGVYVVDIERDGRIFTLHGLRDPLAASLDDIAAGARLESDQIVAELRPYQSLEPEILFLRARGSLGAPATVSVAAGDQVLILSGTATQDWIDSVRRKVEAGTLGWAVNVEGVESLDLQQLQADVTKTNDAQFYFSNDAILRESDAIDLRQHAEAIRELVGRAERLNASLRISILGYTDGVGPLVLNTSLAALRAEAAAQVLIEEGIDPGLISRSGEVPTDESGEANPELRRVAVQLRLRLPEGPNFVVPE